MNRTVTQTARAAVFILLLSLTLQPSALAAVGVDEIVRLYSDGRLVATWQAIAKGRMQDGCYVFLVRKGARKPQVRVCGTFTVEEVD